MKNKNRDYLIFNISKFLRRKLSYPHLLNEIFPTIVPTGIRYRFLEKFSQEFNYPTQACAYLPFFYSLVGSNQCSYYWKHCSKFYSKVLARIVTGPVVAPAPSLQGRIIFPKIPNSSQISPKNSLKNHPQKFLALFPKIFNPTNHAKNQPFRISVQKLTKKIFGLYDPGLGLSSCGCHANRTPFFCVFAVAHVVES